MKRLEGILGGLALLALLLKLSNFFGASLLLVFFFSCLILFYLFMGVALFNQIPLKQLFRSASYSDCTQLRLWGGLCTGLILSHLLAALIFKLMLWPGADEQLVMGLVLLGALLLIAGYRFFKAKSDYQVRIFRRIAIYGFVGGLALLVPSTALIDHYYGADPEIAAARKALWVAPDSVELQYRFHELMQEKENKGFREWQAKQRNRGNK